MIVVPPCGWVAAIDRGGTVSVGPKAAVAVGIVIVRLLAPLYSMVGTVQSFPKNGKENPSHPVRLV